MAPGVTTTAYTRRVERYQRQARNEALVRDVNERMATLDRRTDSGWVDGIRDRFEFRCECGQSPTCQGSVSMTLAEYEEVRAQPDRFVLVPGHDQPVVETLVKRTDRFVIVDKRNEYEPYAGVDLSAGDR